MPWYKFIVSQTKTLDYIVKANNHDDAIRLFESEHFNGSPVDEELVDTTIESIIRLTKEQADSHYPI